MKLLIKNRIITFLTLVVFLTPGIVNAAPSTKLPIIPGTGDKKITIPVKPIINSNQTPVVEWEKTFGTKDSDDYGHSVQQTTDGGYIITGGSYPKHHTDIMEWITESIKPDIYLVKTSADGSKQWEKTFGSTTGYDFGYSVQQTADGGFIIVGTTDSYGAGKKDIYLIKTGADGSKQWEKTFGSTGDDCGYSVQQTADGGYIIAGETRNSDNTGSDMCLIKTGADGSKQWEKTFGISRYEIGYSVQQTTDGGYIIVGDTNTSTSLDTSDIYLVKTNANGSKQWKKPLEEKIKILADPYNRQRMVDILLLVNLLQIFTLPNIIQI